jgi:hypothetical protein
MEEHPFVIFTENLLVWVSVYGGALLLAAILAIYGNSDGAIFCIVGIIGSFVFISLLSILMWYFE